MNSATTEKYNGMFDVRAKRAKKTAEVFTPDELVCEMLSKLPKETWEEGKTYLDPAVGNGQFLIWVLIRKISLGHNPTEALKTLYGADIYQDNVNECKLRLLKVMQVAGINVTIEHVRIVSKNIFWCRPDVYSKGSLDYDFEFDHEIKPDRLAKAAEWAIGVLNKKAPDGRLHVEVPPRQAWIDFLKKWFCKKG